MPTVSASVFCEKPFFERSRRTFPAKRASRLMTNSVRETRTEGAMALTGGQPD
jgi:hypothetical protein